MEILQYLGEEWRDIKGYEGLYQVSSLGRVKSLSRKTGNQYCRTDRILKLKKSKSGYYSAGLFKDNKQKWLLVHRLVAQAFIPNPNNLPQVNHKDENPANNCVENLEWCSAKYNSNYGNHTKTYERPINKPNRPDKSKVVCQYSLDGVLLNTYPSTKEAERQTGIRNSKISGCCRGEYGYKTAGGFKWRYA